MFSAWERRELLRSYAYAYLSVNPCIDCGETRIATLQFDHRGDKRFEITQGIKNRVGLSTLVAEINKCDVRCANCHAVKTSIDQDWYRRL